MHTQFRERYGMGMRRNRYCWSSLIPQTRKGFKRWTHDVFAYIHRVDRMTGAWKTRLLEFLKISYF